MNELLIVVGLALADAINPTTLAIGLYLVLHKKYVQKTLFFIAGIFSTYYVFGLVLEIGFAHYLRQLWLQQHPIVTAIMAAVGLAIIGYGLSLKQESSKSARLQSASLISAHSAFGLGILSTILDLPTAFPYLGAITLIGRFGSNLFQSALLLLGYNLIVILPLVLMLALRLSLRDHSKTTTKRLSNTILIWERPVLRFMLIVIGALFLLNALRVYI